MRNTVVEISECHHTVNTKEGDSRDIGRSNSTSDHFHSSRRPKSASWQTKPFVIAFTKQIILLLVVIPLLSSTVLDVTEAIGIQQRSSILSGVYASDNFLQRRLFGLEKAASFAAQESFQEDQQRPSGYLQQPFLIAGSNDNISGSSLKTDGNGNLVGSEINVINATTGGPMSLQEVNEERWGQTSAYMPSSNRVLFTGGQVKSSEDGVIRVTNDVFTLDMSNGTIANGYLKQTTEAGQNRWHRSSSDALPPHAFAARAVTHTGDHQGEQIFVIGGATADCSISNSPVYVWNAAKHGQVSGSWSAPNISMGQTIPPRRRGMSAMQVPVSIGLNSSEAEAARQKGGSSFMVVGGYTDYTTCNSSTSNSSQAPNAYPYVDIWTTDKSGESMSVRTLPIDSRMPNMSIYDYSAVVLPANETAKQNTRILFVGGRDVFGAFTPMNQLWTLDIETNVWQRMETTNGTNTGLDIPLGRTGHSSTLMDDGTILVHGGYVTLDNSQPPSNDTYYLDPRVDPAVWNKLYPNTTGGSTPGKAYHTAIMANGIYMVAFGQQGTVSGAPSTTLQQRADAQSSPVLYLDTRSPGQWSWTTDLGTILAAREEGSSSSSINPPLSPPSPSSSPSPVQASAASSEMSSQSTQQSTEQQTASSSPTPAQSIEAPAPQQSKDDDGSSDGGPSSKTTHTAVIASVVGALAIAASLGGLYAARKRREARNSDADSVGDDKYERYTGDRDAPPVSSLWINQPMAWAGNAGKGLRRQASMATEKFLARTLSRRNVAAGTMQAGNMRAMQDASASGAYDGDRAQHISRDADNLSIASNDTFTAFRTIPLGSRFSIRRSRKQPMEDMVNDMQTDPFSDEAGREYEINPSLRKHMKPLPEDFIKSLLDDGDFLAHSNIKRTVGGGKYLQSPEQSSPRPENRSRESLFSEDGVSHYSYPYLATINRSSMGAPYSARSSTFTPTSSQAAGMDEDFPTPRHDGQLTPGMVRINQDLADEYDTEMMLQSERFETPTIDTENHASDLHDYAAEDAIDFSGAMTKPSPLVQKKNLILQTPNRQDSPRDWFKSRLPFLEQPSSNLFMNPHPALLSIATQKMLAGEHDEEGNQTPSRSLRITNEE
ncbi:uncharacterized protein FA14DRAFT_161214 [Meira miltonrushii]|uniref:Galactose oxidase n=1 Tax=Meira miltonrushii TaxID=1280837 RepID=A0A316V6X6_9BASI|nr:uncharacterized protein FA14DRAFT_161214 [Meira miltonrushii]PWN33290.1 hypothetical protein FA14DRAFT_161214 [Meira miltonrushii]